MRPRIAIASAAMTCGLVFAAGCSGGSGTSVSIAEGMTFDPSSLTVKVGDTVTWTNDAKDAHTVTTEQDSLPAGAAYFASGGANTEEAAREGVAVGLIGEGQTYQMTFLTPGTYRYFCIPHESQGMRGSIVVEE